MYNSQINPIIRLLDQVHNSDAMQLITNGFDD